MIAQQKHAFATHRRMRWDDGSVVLLVLALLLFAISPANASEKRCGWYENPTPANAWLTDKDGQWILGSQGGEQIEDDDFISPSFTDKQWVVTNGISYGYGCACMNVVTNKDHHIKKVLSAKALPLSVCDKDKSLPKLCKKVVSMDSPEEEGKKILVCEDFIK